MINFQRIVDDYLFNKWLRAHYVSMYLFGLRGPIKSIAREFDVKGRSYYEWGFEWDIETYCSASDCNFQGKTHGHRDDLRRIAILFSSFVLSLEKDLPAKNLGLIHLSHGLFKESYIEIRKNDPEASYQKLYEAGELFDQFERQLEELLIGAIKDKLKDCKNLNL